MKKLLLIICLYAGIAGAQTKLTAPLVRNGLADTNPTHFDTLGVGGYAVYTDTFSRNAIPLSARKIGMVAAIGSNSIYMLKNGILNTDWVRTTYGTDIDSNRIVKYADTAELYGTIATKANIFAYKDWDMNYELDNIYNKNTNNVGIGTANPTAKLHVAGNVKIVDGTQGTGKVLTSDETGAATWQTPSGGSSSLDQAVVLGNWTTLPFGIIGESEVYGGNELINAPSYTAPIALLKSNGGVGELKLGVAGSIPYVTSDINIYGVKGYNSVGRLLNPSLLSDKYPITSINGSIIANDYGDVTIPTGSSSVGDSLVRLYSDKLNKTDTAAMLTPYSVISKDESITGTKTFFGKAISDGAPNSGEKLLSTGWTTTGWTGDFVTGFTHTPGNTTPLVSPFTMSSDSNYIVALTFINYVAGSVSMASGATTFDFNNENNYSTVYKPITDGVLSFIPTTTFNGTITISVKTASNPTLSIAPTTSTLFPSPIEIRASNKWGNMFIGRGAGASNTTGDANIFIGLNTGLSITTGYGNVVIGGGSLTLVSSTTYPNVAVGNGVLAKLKGGNGGNTAIGNNVLFRTTTGQYNTGLGYQSMFSTTTGNENSAFGFSTLYRNTTGSNNVGFGRLAGFNNTTGWGNVFIGYRAGYNSTSQSNKLYIADSSAVTLIHGDFVTGQVQINAASSPLLTTCAALDIISTTKGLLLPRLTKAQRDGMIGAVGGLMIYQTDNTPGLRMFNGVNWIRYTETTD